MLVTNKLKMDLSAPDPSLSVSAVQGDAYSRSLRIAFYTGIVPWTIPEGVTAAVRYAKPDRTKGYYDTLPDGSSAWSVQENILTVQLAPQMLTVPGKVSTQIELILGTHLLSTFCLTVHVEPNPAAGVLKSEDYINWLQWIRDQSQEHVSQIRQSVLTADLAAHSAIQASEEAAASSLNAEISADLAKNASDQAVDAAASAAASHQKAESIAADVAVIVARNEAYTKYESDNRYSPSIVPTASGVFITLSDSAGVPLQGLKVFGKTTRNGTPAPDAPVPLESVGESVKVTVCGKNLLKVDFSKNTLNGVTFTNTGDGGVSVTGTTQNYPFISVGKIFLYSGKSYRASLNGNVLPKLNLRIINRNVDPTSITVASESSFKPKVTGWHDFEITVSPGYDGTTTLHPMVEIGQEATAYEPCTEQAFTISTPNGLPGLPVTSGGNYTDEDGQQWICDEVDLGKGVYVQRIASGTLTGDEVLAVHTDKSTDLSVCAGFGRIFDEEKGLQNRYCLTDTFPTYYAKNPQAVSPDVESVGFHTGADYCSYLYARIYRSRLATEDLAGVQAFLNNHNINILYQLVTPIETALTAEELAQYATLHTNYPNTTVFNDEGADMEVKYMADTKLYVDKKFAELAAAIVNT